MARIRRPRSSAHRRPTPPSCGGRPVARLLVPRLDVLHLRSDVERADRPALHRARRRSRLHPDGCGGGAGGHGSVQLHRDDRVGLADRPRRPLRLLLVYYGFRGVSLLFLPFVHDSMGIVVFSVLFGLDYIATVPPTVALCADAFGRRNVGIVYGWVFAAHMFGAALAAWVAGVVRERRRLRGGVRRGGLDRDRRGVRSAGHPADPPDDGARSRAGLDGEPASLARDGLQRVPEFPPGRAGRHCPRPHRGSIVIGLGGLRMQATTDEAIQGRRSATDVAAASGTGASSPIRTCPTVPARLSCWSRCAPSRRFSTTTLRPSTTGSRCPGGVSGGRSAAGRRCRGRRRSRGLIRLVDRLGISNEYLTFGGHLDAAEIDDIVVAAFASQAPLLSRGGHPGGTSAPRRSARSSGGSWWRSTCARLRSRVRRRDAADPLRGVHPRRGRATCRADALRRCGRGVRPAGRRGVGPAPLGRARRVATAARLLAAPRM